MARFWKTWKILRRIFFYSFLSFLAYCWWQYANYEYMLYGYYGPGNWSGFMGFCFMTAIAIFLLWYFILRPLPSPNSFNNDDPRLNAIKKIKRTTDGRYVCTPEKQLKNYYSPSKKFYIFRKGEQLPEHLILVRVPDSVIVSFTSDSRQENKEKARVDLINHGFNALIDCTTSMYRMNYMNQYKLRGRPALIVSKNYRGEIDLLETHCKDGLNNMNYGCPIYYEDP